MSAAEAAELQAIEEKLAEIARGFAGPRSRPVDLGSATGARERVALFIRGALLQRKRELIERAKTREAERKLLGRLLRHPNEVEATIDYNPHWPLLLSDGGMAILEGIRLLSRTRRFVDVLGLGEWLGAHQRLSAVGGMQALASLDDDRLVESACFYADHFTHLRAASA